MEMFIYNGDLLDKTRARVDKPLFLNSCGTHSAPSHRTIRRKGREDYTLLCVLSGKLNADLGDGMQVFEEGTVVLYPPFTPQDYFQSSGEYAWVHITGKSADELVSTAFGDERVASVYPSRDINAYIERMLFHYSRGNNGENLAIFSDILGLFSTIERNRKEGEGDSERLSVVIVEMHKRIAEPLKLKEYASLLGLSEGRFCHLFKDVMGKSPHAYILELRLTRAYEMLLERNYNVSEIAYAVGFSDPLYFSRIFKKRFGISPKEICNTYANF